MSRSVTRSRICCIESPCFCSSATYSLLYSVPICGGFDFPSVVAVVTNTLSPVTMGDDHPRPGISCIHSTFSVFDQRSASRACAPTGFASGPRNCGQARLWPRTVGDTGNSAHARPASHKRCERSIPLQILFNSGPRVLMIAPMCSFVRFREPDDIVTVSYLSHQQAGILDRFCGHNPYSQAC